MRTEFHSIDQWNKSSIIPTIDLGCDTNCFSPPLLDQFNHQTIHLESPTCIFASTLVDASRIPLHLLMNSTFSSLSLVAITGCHRLRRLFWWDHPRSQDCWECRLYWCTISAKDARPDVQSARHEGDKPDYRRRHEGFGHVPVTPKRYETIKRISKQGHSCRHSSVALNPVALFWGKHAAAKVVEMVCLRNRHKHSKIIPNAAS